MRRAADLAAETEARLAGFSRIAGVDEAGRGPLAGPVVAAAVVLDPARAPAGLADGKALPAAVRDRLAADIAAAAEVGVGIASVEEIDVLNILRASLLAMERAVAALPTPPDLALIDGNRLPAGLPCPARAIVGGDATVAAIAAASIIAKVRRDAIMVALAQQFPGYGWERNKGYPVPAHRAALIRLGPTPHHRRSFAPVHKMLGQDGGITP
jgi:ribonuclease HII